MPAVLTLGGIAVAVLGLLIAFAGLPDRSAGLGLGSDLIQAGASVFAGGLILAALGQVMKALRDLSARVEEAGFGVASPRNSLNDELAEETPRPLPRAASRSVAPLPKEDDFAEPAPEPRAARPAARDAQPQPAPRTPRAAAEPQRPAPRTPPRPEPRQQPGFEAQQQDDEFAEDYAQPREAQRPEPRWMRTQTEANARQQQPGVIPLQSTRPAPRTAPAAPPAAPRRDPAPAAPPSGYEPEFRRRTAASQPRAEEAAPSEPSVVRSGIIAGMAYTLYSDGSIEAELPAGLVRFNSLGELQEHVKRAGAEDQEGDYRGSTAHR